MTDTDNLIRLDIQRNISSWCNETWICTGPLPEDWEQMDNDARFDWATENMDDVYTNDEWPEDTLEIHNVEVESD